MGSGLKLLLAFSTLGTFGFYMARVSVMTEAAQWGFIGALLGQAFVFIILPGKQKKTVVRRTAAAANVAEEEALAEEDKIDIPDPVTMDPLDGATLKQRKMAKIKAIQSAAEEEEDEEVQEISVDEIEEIDDLHIAEEYVVEIDAESIEEAKIEDAVSERRRHHAEIRKRIEMRRREQMAEVRASAAKMWDNKSGEDLAAIVSNEGHGLTILDEPDEVESGHPYGATFIRLDDTRVLKVRVALDDGFKTAELEEEENELPPLLLPDGTTLPLPSGLPLPPLPVIGGLPLPPPPMVGGLPPPPALNSQNKLAALRDEIA
ncbi:MAG TPA: hypothetical protein EYQ85_03585 [Candidatus Poseidoniales archaeon]|jgi:hypothetical protein|nr:MAG: hypothetical protein CXT68_02465 [Euryarchaeota archaeon]HIF16317.1 hypothetical protein [Candidatus Poseidoniales archaeon]